LTACPEGCRDTQTDNQNCGECGIVCGANQTCEDGVCTCQGLWADCDALAETGCEADLARDSLTCGRCQISCGGGPCAAGICRGQVAAIAAGGAHTCVVVAGRVACWGWNEFSQLGVAGVVRSADPGYPT
jgi:hypothetical protein